MTRKPASRRALLGAIAAAAVAGCTGTTDEGLSTATETDTETDTATTAEPTETATETPDERPELEVLHGWTGGDGATAIEALFDGFRNSELSDDVTLNAHAVGGGGNENLRLTVANRLANDDPPSAFGGWPGASLQRYEGALGDIGAVWTDDVRSAYPDELAAAAQLDGAFASVPFSVFGVNGVFYNVDVVQSAGVDPEALGSTADLLDAFAAVERETDAVPLAHAQAGAWTTLQLWETVLLAQSGSGTFRDCFDGRPDADAVEAAFQTVADSLAFVSADAASISFTEANAMVADGDAAFIQQGDWAAGFYRHETLAYGDEWDYVPLPGTDGEFLFQSDAFLYPSNNPTPEATRQFLSYCASADAQVRYTGERTSIPVRTDVDAGGFDPFTRDRLNDFRSASDRVPTVTHGVSVPEQERTDLTEIVHEFTDDSDVERATERTVDVLSS